MSEKDVVFSKINIVKNCLMAIEKAKLQEIDLDFRIALYELNLQRAIQACIDLSNTVISKEGLGLPNSYRQSFQILAKHGIVNDELLKKLVGMVGFRNISVHDYQEIKPEIVESIVEHHLTDFDNFCRIIYDRVMQGWTES